MLGLKSIHVSKKGPVSSSFMGLLSSSHCSIDGPRSVKQKSPRHVVVTHQNMSAVCVLLWVKNMQLWRTSIETANRKWILHSSTRWSPLNYIENAKKLTASINFMLLYSNKQHIQIPRHTSYVWTTRMFCMKTIHTLKWQTQHGVMMPFEIKNPRCI